MNIFSDDEVVQDEQLETVNENVMSLSWGIPGKVNLTLLSSLTNVMNIMYLELIYNLLPLALCLMLFILTVSSLRLHKKTQSQHRQICQLNEELNALLACSRGISERLHHYQNQFQTITERQDKLEVGDAGSAGYKQAIALFKRGASEDEMLSTCDLSRGEINLIAHLQKARANDQIQPRWFLLIYLHQQD